MTRRMTRRGTASDRARGLLLVMAAYRLVGFRGQSTNIGQGSDVGPAIVMGDGRLPVAVLDKPGELSTVAGRQAVAARIRGWATDKVRIGQLKNLLIL